jgi:threonine/homoserine/homoserine lactone efflux protein
MMPLELYLAFVVAVTILILIPGPNVAVIMANSVAHGTRYGFLTVSGTSSAMVIQLALTVAGMTTLLALLAEWFDWLRWLGVAYLVFLGVQAWRAPAVDLTKAGPQTKSWRAIFLRGFIVSMTNPKTLLFYGAFLPQFVSPDADWTSQLLLLSATFLAIAVLLDCGWALLAARFRAVLAMNGRLRNRLTGALMLGAGLGLALARKS